MLPLHYVRMKLWVLRREDLLVPSCHLDFSPTTGERDYQRWHGRVSRLRSVPCAGLASWKPYARVSDTARLDRLIAWNPSVRSVRVIM